MKRLIYSFIGGFLISYFSFTAEKVLNYSSYSSFLFDFLIVFILIIAVYKSVSLIFSFKKIDFYTVIFIIAGVVFSALFL